MDRQRFDVRRLIGLLLVLNLGVLVAGLVLQSFDGATRAPVVFNAEKIRLLARVAESDVPAPATAALAELPDDANDGSAPPLSSPDARLCWSWPALNAERLMAVEAGLRDAGLARNEYDIVLDGQLGWWVYLPPVADATAQSARLEGLREKGVSDLALLRAGVMANAISLGVFPSLEKARQQAASLIAKGIEGVMYAPRPGQGEARLQLFSIQAATRLAATLATWPSGLRPLPCEPLP